MFTPAGRNIGESTRSLGYHVVLTPYSYEDCLLGQKIVLLDSNSVTDYHTCSRLGLRAVGWRPSHSRRPVDSTHVAKVVLRVVHP